LVIPVINSYFGRDMQLKSTLLLFIMGVMMLPWQLVCVAHPFGHHHQQHDGPSLCELRRQYQGTEPVFWPPMDCEHISSQIGHYQLPQTEKGKPTIQTLAVMAILLDHTIIPEYQCDFILITEAHSNSDPPLTSISLRGPPFI